MMDTRPPDRATSPASPPATGPAGVEAPAPGTPLRADARRNRARVLEAAEAVFAAEGIAVPLDEIARRAGVGAGTVYRHFPTKEALFEAVVSERLEQLIHEARALAGADDPGQAFFDFLFRVVEGALLNRVLCDALAAGTGVHVKISWTQEHFTEALGELLVRAQKAHAVRPDLDVADVRAFMVGCVAMEQYRGSPGHMTSIAYDALHPAARPRRSPEGRNETSAATRNETAQARCEVCGGEIPAARTGRPARFCGPACRQKAHRRRGSSQSLDGAHPGTRDIRET
jgi:AcrR family transcriptional regulator